MRTTHVTGKRRGLPLLVGCLVFASMAGCLGGTELDVLEGPVSVLGPKLEEWVVLEARGSPEGALSSFLWQVPEGATDSCGPECWPRNDMWLEIAPLIEPGAVTVDAWGLLTLRLGGGAVMEDWHVEVPYTDRAVLASALDRREHAVDLSPRQTRVVNFDFKDGDTIGFVVLAQTAAETSFPLAVRARTNGGDHRLAVTGEEVRSIVAAGGVRSLTPVREEAGFEVAFYYYSNPAGVPGSEILVGPVEVRHFVVSEAGVPGPVRVIEAKAEHESRGGWGWSFGDVRRLALVEAVNWTVDSSIRGSTLQTGRTFAQGPLGNSDGEFYVHAGEGSGPSRSTFSLHSIMAGEIVGTVVFASLALDSTMTDLFGVPGANVKEMTEFGRDSPMSGCLPILARLGSATGCP